MMAMLIVEKLSMICCPTYPYRTLFMLVQYPGSKASCNTREVKKLPCYIPKEYPSENLNPILKPKALKPKP